MATDGTECRSEASIGNDEFLYHYIHSADTNSNSVMTSGEESWLG